MSRVVVTGATSMIGVALIKECIAHGDEVLAIVRKDTKRMSRLPQSDLLHLAYADLDSLRDIFIDEGIYDTFYHLAWAYTNKKNRDNARLQEENIRTTLDAVELAKRLGCKRFVGAGSQAEYGRVNGIISETTPCFPTMAYGMAKLSAYMLSKKLCESYDMTHVWGRIFSVYGTNDNDDTMIDYALKCFANGEVAKFSSGEQSWNYLFEDDAGKVFYALGCADIEEGVYCVANEESRKLKEYITIMAQEAGASELIEFNANVNALGLSVNSEKLRKSIGRIDYVDFSEGIKKVISSR